MGTGRPAPDLPVPADRPPMHSWCLWLLLAAVAVLPVVLRAFGGDDEPDNAVTQEQDGGRGDAQMRRAA